MKSMRQIRARWYAAAGSVLAALALAATQGAAAAGAVTSGPAGGNGPHWSGNLIADGDAGAGYCTRDWNAATTIPGWVIRTGSPNVMCYSTARVGHPAGAAGPGFFSSGPYGDSAMTQTARLAPPAAAGGSLSYRLSGWLGGWKSEPGYVKVSLVFLRPLRPAGRRDGHAAHGVPGQPERPDPPAPPRGGRAGSPGNGVHPRRGAVPGQFHPARRGA